MTAVLSSGCSRENSSDISSEASESSVSSASSPEINSDDTLSTEELSLITESDYFDDEDLLESYDNVTAEINMTGDNAEIKGKGAECSNNVISLSTGGTFVFSGDLKNGQVYVNNNEFTHIIFNGVNISNDTTSPFFVENTDKIVITCVSGTENTLSDGADYVYENEEENEPDAVIFSKDDLSFNGSGLLTVNASYNEGITCKNDLRISGSNINITSAGNGIKGKDSVVIKDSEIIIDSQEDGIKSSNSEEADKGYIVFESGNYNITALEDAVQSENTLTVNNGDFVIKSGSESSLGTGTADENVMFGGRSGAMEGNPNATENSEKGLKAVSNMVINGGTFNIDSTDDGVHSNGNVTINGGNMTINSGDDGIHSDGNVDIMDGEINIESSYEGVEGVIINVDGGNISIVSSDDGINAGDGSESDMTGGFNAGSSSTCQLNINNGTVYVNAEGDGLDSNGIMNINGGTVLVDGPVNDGNGALDSGSEVIVNGGILIAAGSSGMAEVPSESSAQNSVVVTFSQTNQGATPVCVMDSENNVIVSYSPSKEYSSVVISSPELVSNGEYSIYYGGSISTQKEHAVDGVYSGGELLETVTLSGTVTYAGDGSVGQMGGGMDRGGMKPDGDSDFNPDDRMNNDFKPDGNGGMGGMTSPDNGAVGGMDPFGGNMGTMQ